MGFVGRVRKILDIPSSKELEQLNEVVRVQDRLLREAEERAMPITGVSADGQEYRTVDDVGGQVTKRVPVRDCQRLYTSNQFVFRGVNIRADELITRGYSVVDGDAEGRTRCAKLVEDSGGPNLFWLLSVNTDVGGDGYLEAVPNKSKTAILILKHLNPANFGFLTDGITGNIVLGDDGTPKAYMQVVKDSNGTEKQIVVPKERVAHLRFNTFGDEFGGISSLQPLYNTAIRLMNMEHAAAHAAVKTANPTWVVKTQSKSPRDLATWAKILGRISAKDVVFLPDGVDIDLKSPGNENFSPYSGYFLDAVVAALGVPKSILTGVADSGGGNRATVQTQYRHLYSVIRSNQKYVEKVFNDIFIRYAIMAGFNAPKLKFTDVAEDADRAGQRAIELFTSGLITIKEARTMIGLDTDTRILKLLNEPPISGSPKPKTVNPSRDADMEAWHPAEPGSPAGSQKNEKRNKKFNPDVPSVR